MTMRLAVVGLGRMGSAVAALAAERGWEVVARIGSHENGEGQGITVESLRRADVALELTTPRAAPANAIACVRAGCPVVVGTTGWDEKRADVEREVRRLNGAMLVAPNFSLGVHIFWRVAEVAAELAGRVREAQTYIVETHHTGKRDAPSGTARELQRRVEAAAQRPVPVTSVRAGHVPGTHELIIDAPFEQIRIIHEARDRRVFAAGALDAAAWLAGRSGVFTMSDVLDSQGDGR